MIKGYLKKLSTKLILIFVGVVFVGAAFGISRLGDSDSGQNLFLTEALELVQPERLHFDFERLELQAAEGDPKAMALVVQELVRGDSVKADMKRAGQLAEAAAHAGHPLGIYFHQCLVEIGELDEPFLTGDSDAEWRAIFERCQSHKSEPEVTEILTRMHSQGLGTEKDEVAAYEMCQSACKQSIPQAWLRRAYFHEHGEGGAEWNEEIAFECYLKAAGMGSADGHHHVARCYLSGIGTETSPILALGYLAKAAEKKGDSAQEDLQKILEVGVEQFLLQQSPVAFSVPSRSAYLHEIGQSITIDRQLGGAVMHGEVIDRKNGKYLVDVRELENADQVVACACSGQVQLSGDSLPQKIWVPQHCLEQ